MKDKPVPLNYAVPSKQKRRSGARWYKYEYRRVDFAIFLVIIAMIIYTVRSCIHG